MMDRKILLLAAVVIVCALVCPVQGTEECDVCTLQAKPGPCRASIPRYFYSRYRGRCLKFKYGGCQGNGNNFKTFAECTKKCSHLRRRP